MHDIIGAIWENIDFLGGGRDLVGKCHLPIPGKCPPKVISLPQIAPEMSSHFLTFMTDNLRNILHYRAKKSKKYPVLYP